MRVDTERGPDGLCHIYRQAKRRQDDAACRKIIGALAEFVVTERDGDALLALGEGLQTHIQPSITIQGIGREWHLCSEGAMQLRFELGRGRPARRWTWSVDAWWPAAACHMWILSVSWNSRRQEWAVLSGLRSGFGQTLAGAWAALESMR